MPIRYKLTNNKSQTHNETKWGENVTHTADGEGELCTQGWIHVYTDPLLAVLLNTIHADFTNPILWECEVSGHCKQDNGLKEGWTSVTTIRSIPLPVITLNQKIAFGILCAKAVYLGEDFQLWADNWLHAKDRKAAEAGARAEAGAEAWAAEAGAWAAAAAAAARAAAGAEKAWAARAAAAAARAGAAAGAARAAAGAAARAGAAAATLTEIDLIALANQALQYS